MSDIHQSKGWHATQVYAALAVVLLVAAALANSGPVQWGDNGMFIVRAGANSLLTDDLSAAGHPFFNFVSVLAFRVLGAWGVAYLNLILLVVVAIQVHALARKSDLDSAGAWAAVCATLSVHSVLWVATKVEVYLLHVALVLGVLLLHAQLPGKTGAARAWRLVLVGGLSGLALCTHQLTLVVLLPVMLHLCWTQRLYSAWALLGGGIGLVFCLPGVQAQHAAGVSPFDMVRGFLTGYAPKIRPDGWEGQFLRVDRMTAMPHLVASVLLSIFGVGLVGLLSRPKQTTQWILWAMAVLNLVFAITYDVPDRFTFFLPGAICLAVLGVQSLSRQTWRGLSRQAILPLIVIPLLLYHLVPYAAGQWLMTLPRVKSSAPGINPLMYYFVPLKSDRSAEQFVLQYEKLVPPGSVVYSDFQPLEALMSAQLVGRFVGREVRGCEVYDATRPDEKAYLVQLFGCDFLKPHLGEPLAIGYRLNPGDSTKAAASGRAVGAN